MLPPRRPPRQRAAAPYVGSRRNQPPSRCLSDNAVHALFSRRRVVYFAVVTDTPPASERRRRARCAAFDAIRRCPPAPYRQRPRCRCSILMSRQRCLPTFCCVAQRDVHIGVGTEKRGEEGCRPKPPRRKPGMSHREHAARCRLEGE